MQKGLFFFVQYPKCQWNEQIVTMEGRVHGVKENKRNAHLSLCLFQNAKQQQYVRFDLKGNPFDKMVILKQGDDFLGWQVNCRKYEINNSLCLWSCEQGKYQPCYFKLDAKDYSIQPIGAGAHDLRVGLKKGNRGLFLLQKHDQMVIKLAKTAQLERYLKEMVQSQKKKRQQFLKRKAENEKVIHLEFLPPENYKLLEPNVYMLGAFGKQWHVQNNGRGCAIKFFAENTISQLPQFQKCCFTIEGDPFRKCAFRLNWDDQLHLEINYRKLQVGNTLSFWNSNKKTYAPCYFVLNIDDLTISPFGTQGKNLCLGVDANEPKLILVKRKDPLCLKFIMKDYLLQFYNLSSKNYSAQLEKNNQLVKQALTDLSKQKLKKDGFIHLKKLVNEDLVKKALRLVNKMIGQCGKQGKSMPQKTEGPHQTDITDTFNHSAIPQILKALLGPKNDDYRGYYMEGAQIALRFPGHGCFGKQPFEVDEYQFNKVKQKYWHIDGVPSNNHKHYGKLMTFDALVGVYLSQTKEKMNGEFGTYPGSHLKLAQYFKNKENFQKTCQKGELPQDIAPEQLFGTEPVHVLVEPGDVAIVNYMNAHFIAPNTGPNVRYALYFRILGNKYSSKNWEQSALQPLMHWNL